MIIRPKFKLSLLLLIIAVSAKPQNDPLSLNIGDSAPPLRVREWIKGTPVQKFEKGTVYVLEFWATWCKPCIAAMPHLSALAGEYKDRVIVIGIDIFEKKSTSSKKVKAFVDSMGLRMNYHVTAEDSNFVVNDWLDASGVRDEGIPRSFVINAAGRLAWIGHPKSLAEVLPKIVNDTWNIKEAHTKRISDKRLAELDKNANYDLMKYSHDSFNPHFIEKPDSVLLAINEIIRSEPKLKYAPLMAYNTFSSLLKTNLQKAYQYGKVVMVTATYEEPAYSSIYNVIDFYSDKLNLPVEIYRLGAEAYQTDIDHIPYPEIVNIQKRYHRMAALYWRANEKSKAIDAEQKAIQTLKNKKDFSRADLTAFELQLQHYKKR